MTSPSLPPWPDDLARQRAEQTRVASAAAAEEREASAARRIQILDVLEDDYGQVFSTDEIVNRLRRRGLNVSAADVEADLLALVAAGHALDCFAVGDGPRWRSGDNLSARVRDAGLRALVTEMG